MQQQLKVDNIHVSLHGKITRQARGEDPSQKGMSIAR